MPTPIRKRFINLTDALDAALMDDALAKGVSVSEAARLVLEEHYNLPHEIIVMGTPAHRTPPASRRRLVHLADERMAERMVDAKSE